MDVEISLADVSAPNRNLCISRSAEIIAAELRSRFPEEAGFQYTVPTSESPFRTGAGPEFIVRRGLAFGLRVSLRAVAGDATKVKLSTDAWSRLSMMFGCLGFLFGEFVLAALVIHPDGGIWNPQRGLLQLLLFGGIIAGVAFAFLAMQIAASFQSPTRRGIAELSGVMQARVNEAISDMAGQNRQ